MFGSHSDNIEILVRTKQFNVQIFKGRTADGLGKREATNDGRDDLAKRQKGAAGETVLDPRDTANEVTAAFMDLEKGNTVYVDSLAGSMYSLSISKRKSVSPRTQVYKCLHSKIFKPVAAKVFCYKPNDISRVAKRWQDEKKMLQKLEHENIVKLMAVDGRIFTLFQEYLPPTLDNSRHHKVPLLPRDAQAILRDMSSALEYLELKNIIHGDVKPENIAYSRSRGAVLLDFEFAKGQDKISGGTVWYMPLEVMETGLSSHTQDIWALGVTMLYLTGAIPLPGLDGAARWSIAPELRQVEDEEKKKTRWINGIAVTRKSLLERKLKEPQVSEVYSLIHQMLHPEAEARVSAAELHAAAKKLSIGQWVQRSKSPES
ncbi:kinase-like domain-containing protein [Trichoderma austrokoningii]